MNSYFSMKFRCLITFLMLIAWSFASNGQTLYELKYSYETDYGPEHYRAFLVINEDGTGLIRIAFTDLETETENIVEYDVEEYYDVDKHEDMDNLYYITSNPIQIKGDISYPPDHFVLSKNKETGYYEPAMVISFTEGEEEVGQFDSVVLLKESDLTEDFIGIYFTPDDEIYQNLFVNEVRPVPPFMKNIQLHLILVANTYDPVIGKTCVVDRDNILKLFDDITNFLQIGYDKQIVDGQNFSRKNVDQAIANLSPGPNDIVVFYYTGHGYNPETGNKEYPNLDLRARESDNIGGLNTLNIEEIFRLIQNKQGRLNLVLSDCCNNDIFSTNSISSEAASLRSSSVGWNKNFCSDLFLNSKKSVLMTGASKGQLSAGNIVDGGFFTFNLRDNITKSIGKMSNRFAASWESITKETQKLTKQKAENSKCRMPDKSVRSCNQTPDFMIK